MPINNLYDAQSAMAFAVQQASNIETTIYEVKYPSFEFRDFVPIVTEGNEWARSTTFYSQDVAGKADWISGAANDMPYVDLNRSKYEQPFFMAGIGYQWNLEELNVARMLGSNMPDDKARGASKRAQEMLWNIAMTGDTPKAWTGLINDAGVTAGNVLANGSGSTTLWANKTADQILNDINIGISGVFTSTQEVEIADTILLPSAIYQSIASIPRATGSDMTIMNFLQKNNAYTAQTGQPLMIKGLRALATAGSGSTGRMVVYRRDKEVVRFHLPMPHRFEPVWQNGPMNWMVPGIMRTGGIEIRLPKAIRYYDGIL